MNTKKRQRKLNITLIVLALLSVGMFGYANIYQPNFTEEKVVKVYVADQDIPAKVDLESNMFKSVEVHEDAYIDGVVTDVNQVVGKQLVGQLEEGELLFKQRLDDEVHSDGPLIAEITVPTTIPLSHNDSVRVYVQYSGEGGLEVEELFHEKRVIGKEQIGKEEKSFTGAIDTSANNGSVVYVRLTDKEAMEYQKAVKTGELYAVKIEEPEDKSTLSSGKESTDRKPIQKEEEDTESNTVASYQVQEGDTIKTIAERFMTSEDKIVELNDNKQNFTPGDIINVPGN